MPNPSMTGDLVERLSEAYDKVKFWPEKRMPGVDVSTLGEGFSDLLALRNFTPATISLITKQADRIAVLEALIEDNGSAWLIERARAARNSLVTP